MKNFILKAFLVIIFLMILSGCGNTQPATDVQTLSFPGTTWDMTPEEIIEAFNLKEDDYETVLPDEGNPYYQLNKIHIELFGSDSEVMFAFEDINGDGTPHLRYVYASYPDETDFDSVLSSMKKAYGEPETGKIAETLLQRGKLVVLPRCLPEYRLEGRGIRDRSDLKPGKYGIPEPGEECPVIERDTIDLILVPNLCCDKQGYRLGHGAGYYDRYLVGYRGITVSLCPGGWLQEQVPRDEFDVPVQVVLTETDIWRGEKTPRHVPMDQA